MTTSIKVDANQHLADALRFLSRVPKNEDGRISWSSNELNQGTFEVIYSLKFTPPIDDHIKDGAVWHALNECARACDFSSKSFLQRIKTYLQAHFSKQPKAYLAIAQINATFSAALPSSIPSTFGPITIQANLPKSCSKVIGRLDNYERERLGLHDDFLYASYKVASNSDRSALDVAYRTIKYGLGVLNLATHGYGVSHRSGFPNAPIGTFLLASPIFLIDTRERKLGGWQSESHYPTQWKRHFRVWQRQNPEHIVTAAKHFQSDLARIDFKDRLIQAIILFQEGLEATHVDTALLKFWTGIEVLCAKETREVSERVVERASSIFTDTRHAAMRLDFIQGFRNKIVHRGEAGDHALLCAQYGSIYLAELIRFFLWNRYKFRSRELILDFLSLPLDEEKLTRNISINRKRLASVKRRATKAGGAS
ncbi:hypothetical protein JQ607_09825 [Bradyrhizobium liaoningense]|uniref:HEPN domain-containing protein n=1 Tax=Bradyrhizobium liaoningense TaxID=43992 RepID=UPI001BADCD19|nr:HEPN domain-containing protein [Bradyrhizobium liaoningense]MBR0840484.1 hypothetical protein [Bradyrhizobium liaoningense]